MDTTVSERKKNFEELKHLVNGVVCWDARELMHHVGYGKWQDFSNAIGKAKMSCITTGEPVEKHFLRTSVNNSGVRGRPGVNYLLSRHACYLVFQNGDPTKPDIAAAQAYFNEQVRKQESIEQLNPDERRVFLRDKVESSTQSLTQVATQVHGVTNPGRFHEAGNYGLYNLPTDEVMILKGITEGELLDCIGSTELAAHFFRVTQTEEVLSNDAYEKHYFYDQEGAEEISRAVGLRVRCTMRENGSTLPEELPALPDIEFTRQRLQLMSKPRHKRPLQRQRQNPDQTSLIG